MLRAECAVEPLQPNHRAAAQPEAQHLPSEFEQNDESLAIEAIEATEAIEAIGIRPQCDPKDAVRNLDAGRRGPVGRVAAVTNRRSKLRGRRQTQCVTNRRVSL